MAALLQRDRICQYDLLHWLQDRNRRQPSIYIRPVKILIGEPGQDLAREQWTNSQTVARPLDWILTAFVHLPQHYQYHTIDVELALTMLFVFRERMKFEHRGRRSFGRPLTMPPTSTFATTFTKHDASMRSINLFLRLAGILLLPALIGTTYLYFYPFFNQCGFPTTPAGQAPFRLLAFGDPQIEGDSSLPENGGGELFPTARKLLDDIANEGYGPHRHRVKAERHKIFFDDLPNAFQTYRKKLDLWGNDRYLAHIYRTIRSCTNPTHVAVLGDLLGSQWIDDDEFQRRTDRFWKTVFDGAQKVPKHVTDIPEVERIGQENSWNNRIIAIAGNHDIGYAGDLDEHRLERFEAAYGKANWEVRFALNETITTSEKDTRIDTHPELRLVILNSMNLDLPATDQELYDESNHFLNEKLYWDIPSAETGTILLTHIPLHKEAGICTDGPFIEHWTEHPYEGGIKEQNHLTPETSVRILDGLIGPEQNRRAIVLNGHDHTGCDTHHSRAKITTVPEDEEPPETPWHTQKYEQARAEIKDKSLAGVREVTVRSMMGQFGGNAGLLSAWWDEETKGWKFEYSQCMAGVQHIWWTVHVIDLIVVALWTVGLFIAVIQEVSRPETRTTDVKKKQ